MLHFADNTALAQGADRQQNSQQQTVINMLGNVRVGQRIFVRGTEVHALSCRTVPHSRRALSLTVRADNDMDGLKVRDYG